MREIKFRAWDSYQNKMYEWSDICEKDGEGHLTLTNLLNGLTDHLKPMQYTGLKDKNGKEIYEGDILKIYGSIAKDDPAYGYYEPEMEVIYNGVWGSFGFTDGGAFLHFKGEHNYEVIGNIYENKELLD